MKPAELDAMMEALLKKSNWLFSEYVFRLSYIHQRSQNDQMEDTLRHIASFISAFGHIAKEYEDVPPNVLDAIIQVVRVLFTNFPKIAISLRPGVYIALAEVCSILHGKDALRTLLSHTSKLSLFLLNTAPVYRGLILTCSDTITQVSFVYDAEELPEHAYRDYEHLWENLLDDYNLRNLPNDALSEEDRRSMYAIIYDEMMTSILRLTQNLNFNMKQTVSTEETSKFVPRSSSVLADFDSSGGPDGALAASANIQVGDMGKVEAENPKDFQIFLNLVAFVQDILPKPKLSPYFRRWPFLFGQHIIQLSSRYPLVSGFYKLFSVALRPLCQSQFLCR